MTICQTCDIISAAKFAELLLPILPLIEMKIVLNEKTFKVAEGLSVLSFLSENNIPTPKGVALAVNDSVVPRESWEKTTLKDGNKLILISAAQGG